jgi:hypothetical protein
MTALRHVLEIMVACLDNAKICVKIENPIGSEEHLLESAARNLEGLGAETVRKDK